MAMRAGSVTMVCQCHRYTVNMSYLMPKMFCIPIRKIISFLKTKLTPTQYIDSLVAKISLFAFFRSRKLITRSGNFLITFWRRRLDSKSGSLSRPLYILVSCNGTITQSPSITDFTNRPRYLLLLYMYWKHPSIYRYL